MDKQQGPAVQHRTPSQYAVIHHNGKGIWKRMYIYMRIYICIYIYTRITESVSYIVEINTTLEINYTSIK